MNWSHITTIQDVDRIVDESHSRYQIIFKHSTTCPVSSMAKHRLESKWDIDNVGTHYLDLLSYREVSNHIADHLQVHHESPQVILIKDGEVIYDGSHLDISVDEIKESIQYNSAQA